MRGASVAAVALLLAVSLGTAAADTITGPARAIDGDTIEIAGTRVRLFGIDAPERRQTCEGRDGQIYQCGRDAAAVLAELLRRGPITCTPRDTDRYGRTVATCTNDAGDIGAQMVRRGWAVAYRRYGGSRYDSDEAIAKAERLGMWSGRFTMPEDWRRERR